MNKDNKNFIKIIQVRKLNQENLIREPKKEKKKFKDTSIVRKKISNRKLIKKIIIRKLTMKKRNLITKMKNIELKNLMMNIKSSTEKMEKLIKEPNMQRIWLNKK